MRHILNWQIIGQNVEIDMFDDESATIQHVVTPWPSNSL